MASTQLSLLGQYPIELHQTVLERLSDQCQSATAYQATELGFQRDGITTVQDDHVLRIRSVRYSDQPDVTKWSMRVLQKPESARLSIDPNVLQRPLVEFSFDPDSSDTNHPIALASSLGFSSRVFQICSKGIIFQRTNPSVQIELYQFYPSPTSSMALDPSSWIIQISTVFNGSSSSKSAVTTADQKVLALKAVKNVEHVLKGLVDLTRGETTK